MHRRRRPPGDQTELLGVEAELDQMRRPRAPRELRVHRLVAPVRLALEKVGEPPPALVEEHCLVDDLGTALYGFARLAGSAFPVKILAEADLLDPATGVDQLGEVASFMLVTLAPDQIPVGVVAERLLELVASDGEGERRQMLAAEVVRQIGRRQEESIFNQTHAPYCRRDAPSRLRFVAEKSLSSLVRLLVELV